MQEMRESEVADQFVKGLDYPVSKDAIVESAREANLSQTIQDAVAKLPDREYEEPDELTEALNAV
jgi:uncharacterized protein DUF2795